MTDRPSLDVASAEFAVHPEVLPTRYSDAHDDVEAQHRPSSEGGHSMRSKKSIRSLLGRSRTRESTKTRASKNEHDLTTISEETGDDGDDHSDEFMVDLKEARLEDEGIKGEETDKYKKRMARHREIQKYTKQSSVIKFLRSAYDDILSRTLITRSFIWWLPLAAILFIPLAVDAWGNRVLTLGKVRVMWIFIWLEVSWGSYFVSRQFAHYMPGILGFFVAIIAPKYFFTIDALFALELPVTLFFWLFITFITFKPITATNPKALPDNIPAQQWQDVVQNVLVAFFLSGLFFLLEQLFIHMLSVSYHKTRMAQRIRLNKRSTAIISQLLYAAWQYFPCGCQDFAEEDQILTSSLLAMYSNAGNKVKKLFGNKLGGDVSRSWRNAGAALSTVLPTGFKGSLKDADKIVREALPNATARRVLAERIWKSLVLEDHDELDMEDILAALGKENNEDSLYIFDLLDLDGQGTISLDEMVSAVRGIGKESKNISRALQDIDGAITKLHYLLLVVLAIIVIVIFVGMVAPSAATVLATLGTTILGFSFVFSTTAAEILSSCVFLFVKHPLDIGDTVLIDCGTLGNTRLIVKGINLLTTVFQDANTNTTRQASNSVLNTLFIDNISRSPPQTVVLTMTLGMPETTFEHLEIFRTKISEYLEAHPRDYASSFYYQIINQPDLDRITLFVIVTCRNNQEDAALFGIRRTRFYEFVSRCVHDIPLQIPRRESSFNDPATPFYSEKIDHTNRVPTRAPFGMYKPEDVDIGRSTSIRRSESRTSHTTGRRKRMVPNFASKS